VALEIARQVHSKTAFWNTNVSIMIYLKPCRTHDMCKV
jgi:hypothetical protein